MKDKQFFRWGLTIFLSACAVLVFYDTFFLSRTVIAFLSNLTVILTPVLYGFAMAYLLAPVVDFFDRLIGSRKKARGGRVTMGIRAVSLTLTWVIVLLLFYGLMNMLIPSLVDSITKLAGNVEGYYNVVSVWATKLLEDNPAYGQWTLNLLNTYYEDLLSMVTQKWLPQAQEALLMVTGGIWSFLIFTKNLLIGIVVSVYLLASKEHSANSARRVVCSLMSEERYQFFLRGVAKVDEIFSGFVRGKLLDSLIIGILCFVGAAILKFPYAPLVSVIVGVTNIIPVFGPFLGAVPCALLILLDSPIKCLYFIIFVIVLQQIDGNIIGPKILGGSTGLSGFGVMVAILVGGGFGGVLGMFLGVPILACLYTAGRAWVEWRLKKKNMPLDTDAYALVKPAEPAADTSAEKKDK